MSLPLGCHSSKEASSSEKGGDPDASSGQEFSAAASPVTLPVRAGHGFPDRDTSVRRRTARVIGGHLAAVLVGSALAGVLNVPPLERVVEGSRYISDLMAALSVGLSIMVMAMTDTEHPPAAGTALGSIIPGWSWSAVVFIISSAVVLSLIGIILRPRLVNLL